MHAGLVTQHGKGWGEISPAIRVVTAVVLAALEVAHLDCVSLLLSLHRVLKTTPSLKGSAFLVTSSRRIRKKKAAGVCSGNNY